MGLIGLSIRRFQGFALSLAALPPVFPHQGGEVLGRAVPGDLQQKPFIGRRGTAGHGPHLGIADGAGGKCCIDGRQSIQTLRHPHFFPRRAKVDAAVIIQPVGRRLEIAAITPGHPLDEGGQQFDEAVVGGTGSPPLTCHLWAQLPTV
ncbi:MAG: hypothetical protein RLZZ385_2320 [Pseudomonadota bacterium]|jgi:hypothetical protein